YPIYDDVALKTYLLNRNGNLGAEILSRFNITFDYEGGSMYLKPNMTFKRPFDHDMAGIEIYSEQTKPRRFYVSRIESGSPADLAGIREGDEILTVNFTKTSTMDLDDLNKLLRSGDEKTVFFSLNRSGDLLIKMIKLKKRI
ncbi:MAG TPA: PDZ domain-containing protein, partial [Pedobacter sp.]|uniref:PDZ domain-containing protein n=1 Tax=Pedobacter sp. TaxID=1411316 RepID=UPI002BABED58